MKFRLKTVKKNLSQKKYKNNNNNNNRSGLIDNLPYGVPSYVYSSFYGPEEPVIVISDAPEIHTNIHGIRAPNLEGMKIKTEGKKDVVWKNTYGTLSVMVVHSEDTGAISIKVPKYQHGHKNKKRNQSRMVILCGKGRNGPSTKGYVVNEAIQKADAREKNQFFKINLLDQSNNNQQSNYHNYQPQKRNINPWNKKLSLYTFYLKNKKPQQNIKYIVTTINNPHIIINNNYNQSHRKSVHLTLLNINDSFFYNILLYVTFFMLTLYKNNNKFISIYSKHYIYIYDTFNLRVTQCVIFFLSFYINLNSIYLEFVQSTIRNKTILTKPQPFNLTCLRYKQSRPHKLILHFPNNHKITLKINLYNYSTTILKLKDYRLHTKHKPMKSNLAVANYFQNNNHIYYTHRLKGGNPYAITIRNHTTNNIEKLISTFTCSKTQSLFRNKFKGTSITIDGARNTIAIYFKQDKYRSLIKNHYYYFKTYDYVMEKYP